jgi:SAM-dependent methyltransferase
MAAEDEITRYYDDVPRKLRDFLHGNRRVDAAWRNIASHPGTPQRVLEVGCGIGHVTARISRSWPRAEVTGIDLSPTSIDVARKLFGDTDVRFAVARLEEVSGDAEFDLIVLMDLHEHIQQGERADFHGALAAVMAPTADVFLSFPTPGYQAHLRAEEPHKLQPVDEDVGAADLERLAAECGGTLEHYRKISVWRRFDYAHAWIRREADQPLRRAELPPLPPDREGHARRRDLVVSRLGQRWVEAADQA